MTRAEAIRAALALVKEYGINPCSLKVIVIRNTEDCELTIGPAAAKPFWGTFGGLNSDHVVSRSSKPHTLTIEALDAR